MLKSRLQDSPLLRVPNGSPRESFLLMQDGSLFFGKGFGAEVDAVGEVVFNTGMVGYCESLTDPSYAGQILCFTYPLIGNYGVPPYSNLDRFGLPRFFESDSIKATGVVVHEACQSPSHWASRWSLNDWLASEGIPGVEGIDTRALVTRLREYGVMMGVLANRSGADSAERIREILNRSSRYDVQNFVKGVSLRSPSTYGTSERRVVLIDCGCKLGIVRNLLDRGFQVVRMPYDSTYSDVARQDPEGVVVSNGPGDPQLCKETVETTGRLIDSDVPLLGICLGEQIVGLSQGARTFKLKYGHRGQNKPCLDVTTGRGYVTSQNHGYALEQGSLRGTELVPWFLNADDGTVEGVLHRVRPCLAVQFHPEASPGPFDTGFVFDRFVASMSGARKGGEEIRSVKA
jgi:carbamoyl-phosphate synthase small subunit